MRHPPARDIEITRRRPGGGIPRADRRGDDGGGQRARRPPRTYTRYELLRAFRTRRFFIFSLGFPVVLYFVIAGPNATSQLRRHGISLPRYYMVSLASFGTMMAMISSGARIAGERQAGWTRQLRITPLSVRAYFRAKVLTSYAMATTSLALLYLSGAALGVRLPAHSWLEMTGLILVGLLPFAALGITLGHLMTVESIGPITGGPVAARDPERDLVPDRQRLRARPRQGCRPTGSFRRGAPRSPATPGEPRDGS